MDAIALNVLCSAAGGDLCRCARLRNAQLLWWPEAWHATLNSRTVQLLPGSILLARKQQAVLVWLDSALLSRYVTSRTLRANVCMYFF
jgi:hypothetical protein